VGTTAGIVAMTLVLWPSIRRSGVRLRWRFQPRHAAVRKVASLSGWTVGYVIANQIALAVVVALALRRSGDAAAYTYAFVFFQLPHGLFAVSLMTTVVPELASAAIAEDWASYRRRFAVGLRMLLLVILPAAAGYVLLARPVVTALLARGALDAAAAHKVADTLAAFALGLVGYSVYLFALRGFYALQNTRTPFLLNVVKNAANVVLAVALVGRLHVQGLALAYSIAYTLAGAAALVALRRRVGALEGGAIMATALKAVAATAAMTAAVLAVRAGVGGDTGSGAALRAGVGVVVGAGVYAVAVVTLRVEELAALTGRFRRGTKTFPGV
jgi:putative peptidoglycan lipid II flippase